VPALPSEPALHLEPLFLRPAARRDVRAAWRQVPVSRTVLAWLRASPGELPGPEASEQALPSELVGPRTAVWLRAVEVSAWQPDVRVLPRAAGVAEAAHAAAEPGVVHVAGRLREAASVASVQPAGVGAAAEPDVPPVAGVAASGVRVRLPAEVRRADAGGQPSAGERSGEQEPRAAVRPGAQREAAPSALPSEAASVFRQGPSLGPARPRAARFAHAMRSLRIASRSEPSWQAARSEDWSCREIPRKVL